jgi:hypothetical protein
MDRVSASEAEGRAFESRRARHFDEHIAWIAQNPEVPRLRPGGYRRPKYWVDRPKAID